MVTSKEDEERTRTMTTVRTTIVIDYDLHQKIRSIQAFLIKETSKSISYSYVLTEILKISIKDKKLDSTIKKIIEAKKFR